MRRLAVLCVLWALAAAARPRGIHSCAHITPQSPTLELGTNLTAFCSLNLTCLRVLNHPITPGELFWKVGSTVIPERQYTLINDAVSSVTFEPNQSTHNSLTCSFKAHGQNEITLHGIYFTLGYPPEKPQNLSCICYNRKTLTCRWEPGRDPMIETNYTVKQRWYNGGGGNCSAKEKNNFCTLDETQFSPHINTYFSVEAVNALGEAVSEPVMYDIITIVKPDPPVIVSVSAELQKVLKVEWRNPMDNVDLIYNLRYRPQDSSEWSEVPDDDLQNTRNSYRLQELAPYTVYVISIRCKLKSSQFWSDWSKESTSSTSESEPSRGPDLWRKISKTDSDEKRVVQLMWKELKAHANGIIRGYNVTVKRGPEVVDSLHVKDTTCNITVLKDSYEVELTAYNNQGSSPPSRLIIPSVTDKKILQPAAVNFTAFPKDGQLWVEWTPPPGRVLGYVIEWCSNSETMNCDVEWQREPSNVVTTYLRGDIKPFVYYLIRLHPLYRDGQDRSSTLGTYLQQGAPDEGPAVQTTATWKTWVILAWKPVPLHKQNGFITSYTIAYGIDKVPSKYITVNSTVTEYTLRPLTAKTSYSVTITANTQNGSKAGLPLTFVTQMFDSGEVEAIVVSSCLGFLVFVLLLCFLFCNKKDQIKKHIWPNVPDPSKSNIAQWSPQTPSRHESKRHPFQDGPFTDVSVVEITADEKKSDSDPDLKSVDQIKKNTSEGLSSGIGGSSCLSSPQLSGSDSDGSACTQNTSSTVQYSTVIMGGYQGQTPMFSRSESTQPLLMSEERPDEQPPASEEETHAPSQYFKQNFTQEDGGRIQDPSPTADTQEPEAKILQLAGFHDSPDSNAGLNVYPDSQSQGDEQKVYLPQKQGGYMPQ